MSRYNPNQYKYNQGGQYNQPQTQYHPYPNAQYPCNSSNKYQSAKNEENIDQNQNEYRHKYVPGEYSAKHFVNYYRNDLLPNNQPQPQNESNVYFPSNQTQSTTQNEIHQNDSPQSFAISNENHYHSNDNFQNPSYDENTRYIENPRRVHPNVNNKNDNINTQANEYRHKYVQGEYSSKPFINYYRNDLLPNNNSNAEVNQNDSNVYFPSNQTQSKTQNEIHRNYSPQSFAIDDRSSQYQQNRHEYHSNSLPTKPNIQMKQDNSNIYFPNRQTTTQYDQPRNNSQQTLTILDRSSQNQANQYQANQYQQSENNNQNEYRHKYVHGEYLAKQKNSLAFPDGSQVDQSKGNKMNIPDDNKLSI